MSGTYEITLEDEILKSQCGKFDAVISTLVFEVEIDNDGSATSIKLINDDGVAVELANDDPLDVLLTKSGLYDKAREQALEDWGNENPSLYSRQTDTYQHGVNWGQL